jgi:hypothetical protein
MYPFSAVFLSIFWQEVVHRHLWQNWRQKSVSDNIHFLTNVIRRKSFIQCFREQNVGWWSGIDIATLLHQPVVDRRRSTQHRHSFLWETGIGIKSWWVWRASWQLSSWQLSSRQRSSWQHCIGILRYIDRASHLNSPTRLLGNYLTT